MVDVEVGSMEKAPRQFHCKIFSARWNLPEPPPREVQVPWVCPSTSEAELATDGREGMGEGLRGEIDVGEERPVVPPLPCVLLSWVAERNVRGWVRGEWQAWSGEERETCPLLPASLEPARD